MRFKTKQEAYDYINKKIEKLVREAVIEVITDHIIPTMLENIDKVVYDAYTPTGENKYIRRFERDGLADTENIDFNIDIKNGKIEVFVRNNAILMGKKTAKNGYKYKLDELLVDGEANWKASQWYANRHPRDFYKATINEMRGELPILLQNAFKKRGINLKFDVRFI